MTQTLIQFTEGTSLFDAASAFLGVLGIKHSGYATKEPLPLTDYFDDKMPQYLQDANATIAKLYDLGCVNDSSLGGTSSVENPKYEAMNIFAFDAKPQARITRTVVSSLTRAFNRIADDPVILIIRQGNYMTLSTCDREKGAKVEIMGKVTILRNVDCANPHPGHIQILGRIAKEVNGCSDFDTLYKKWLYSFSLKLLSDDFFDGYKAIYEDIIALTTGKRMKKEGGKWVERIDDEIPAEEKATYGAKVMASFAQFEDPEKAVRDYVKKLMGRLVFIQFLQKKGWMGVPADKPWGEGDREFIQSVFKQSAKKDNFVDEVLEPLFRDINSDRAGFLVSSPEVSFSQQIKVPYLNGGLFEEDAYDRADFAIPAKYFWNENATLNTKDKDLGLLQFFAKYNFTIDENAPDDVEVGVDPEMLGRIFENLLEDNKDKGAFYTPKEIVQYMCRESLIAYLTTYSVEHGNTNPYDKVEAAIRTLVINPAEIVPQMKQHKPQALQEFGDALRNIKVCDPAIGSGAFPMGLLNELVRCREAIGAWAKDEDGNLLVDNRAALKCEIVCNNIYGVDIERGAIDIARLRFWLSIVVDETTPQTLPNLDYKFMQGNSLITTFDGKYVNLDTKNQQHSNIVEMRKVKQELHKLKLEYYNATGDHKHKLDIKIKDAILRLISLQLGYEVWKWYNENVNQQLTMFPEMEQPRQLTFADIKQELPEETKRICDLGAELRKQLKDDSKSLTERSQVDIRFFDWRMMFTEVFEGENPGFDIVIGNPPYIKEYVNRSAFDGFRESSPYYMGKMDLWYGFACNGLDLLKVKGILSFIAQNNWTTSAGAKKMRDKVVSDSRILQMVDFNDYMVFEDSASIQTMIMIFSHDIETDNYIVDYRRMKAGSKKDDVIPFLSKTGNHLYLAPEFSRELFLNKYITFSIQDPLLNKIGRNSNRFLDDEIAQGIVFPQDFLNKKGQLKLGHHKVGDGIFGLSNDELISLGLNENEMSLIKPYYTSDQIHRYYSTTNNSLWMIYTSSDYKRNDSLDNYPKIKKHLDQFLPIFTSDNKPYGLHRARKESFFIGNKILALRKSVGHPSFTYSEGDCYVTQTYYSIKTERWNMMFLVGLLNSKLVEFWLRNKGKMQGENFQLDKEPLLNIPLPLQDCAQSPIAQIVKKIIIDKLQDSINDVSPLETQIDRLVYELYGLTNGEVKIIDPAETTVGSDDDLFKAL